MKYIGDLKHDVLSNFADGESVTIDMYNEIQRAFMVLASKITPKLLKEERIIYNGIHKKGLFIDDSILRPANFLNFDYTIHYGLDKPYTFNIIKNIEFDVLETNSLETEDPILINDNKTLDNIISDPENALTEIKTTYVALNDIKMLRAEFRDGRNKLKFKSDLKVSDVLGLTVVLPIYFSDNNIDTLELNINGVLNVISVTEIYKKSGWKLVEFNIPSIIDGLTGEEDLTYSIIINLLDTNSNQSVYLESIKAHKEGYEFEYYTDKFVIDRENRVKKSIPTENSDILMLTPIEYELLIYETAKIVANKIVKENILGITLQKFDAVLNSLYNSYSGADDALFQMYDTNERPDYVDSDLLI